MLSRLNKRAQSTAEYAILIAIVIGAAVGMQVYVKRGLQGRVHDAVGYVEGNAGGATLFTGNQYEPYYSTSAMTSTRDASVRDGMAAGGVVTKTIVGQDVSTRTGLQTTLDTTGED